MGSKAKHRYSETFFLFHEKHPRICVREAHLHGIYSTLRFKVFNDSQHIWNAAEGYSMFPVSQLISTTSGAGIYNPLLWDLSFQTSVEPDPINAKVLSTYHILFAYHVHLSLWTWVACLKQGSWFFFSGIEMGRNIRTQHLFASGCLDVCHFFLAQQAAGAESSGNPLSCGYCLSTVAYAWRSNWVGLGQVSCCMQSAIAWWGLCGTLYYFQELM